MSTIQEERLSGIQSQITSIMEDLSLIIKRVEAIGVEVDEAYQTMPCQISIIEGGGNKHSA